jgi:hypothetical protein
MHTVVFWHPLAGTSTRYVSCHLCGQSGVREGPADGHGVCVAGHVAEPYLQLMLDEDEEREDGEEDEGSKKEKGMSNVQESLAKLRH